VPSTSRKQHNFMEAVAHNAAFAKKAGVPQSVGKDFATADKGKTFSKGGRTMAKSSGDTIGNTRSKEKKGMTAEKMGKVRTAAPSRDGIASKGKTRGTVIKMKGNTVGTGKAKAHE
jgi:hypothetical protein